MCPVHETLCILSRIICLLCIKYYTYVVQMCTTHIHRFTTHETLYIHTHLHMYTVHEYYTNANKYVYLIWNTINAYKYNICLHKWFITCLLVYISSLEVFLNTKWFYPHVFWLVCIVFHIIFNLGFKLTIWLLLQWMMFVYVLWIAWFLIFAAVKFL